jgi:hypothetical protein
LLWNLIRNNYARVMGHPRTSVFRRISAYHRVLVHARASNFKFIEDSTPLYTVRAYWDGIWFYGSESYRELLPV